jgi:hypothetical protein
VTSEKVLCFLLDTVVSLLQGGIVSLERGDLVVFYYPIKSNNDFNYIINVCFIGGGIRVQ